MSSQEDPPTHTLNEDSGPEKSKNGRLADATSVGSDPTFLAKGEVFSLESVDPALNAKMHLVNNVRYYDIFYKRFWAVVLLL